MKIGYLSIVLIFLVSLLSGCNWLHAEVSPIHWDGQAEDIDPVIRVEIISNCGSGGGVLNKTVTQSTQMSQGIEWESGTDTGFGFEFGVNDIISVDLRQAFEERDLGYVEGATLSEIGWTMSAEPETQVEYRLEWREIWKKGYIDIRYPNGEVRRVQIRARIDVRTDAVAKVVTECPDPAVAPIIHNVNLQHIREAGKRSVKIFVTFSDANGDAQIMDWEINQVVNGNPDRIWSEDGLIESSPDDQKKGITEIGEFQCFDGKTIVRLEVSITDRENNRSNRIISEIDCGNQ